MLEMVGCGHVTRMSLLAIFRKLWIVLSWNAKSVRESTGGPKCKNRRCVA